ncbi:MAG: hypothetical protein AB8F94_23915 [Saprospiraceae bacterium]
MKFHSILVFLFLFGNLTSANAQIEKIGLLPAHIKIIKKTDEKRNVWKQKIDPSNFDVEGIEAYEKKYLSFLEKAIQEEFKNRKTKAKKFKRKELTEEINNKEEELNDLIWQELMNFRMENNNSISKTKEEKKMKQTGELTEPLTAFFSEQLNRKILLVTQIRGHHTRKKFEERDDKPYPKEARGNINIHGLIIDARSGKILEIVEVQMSGSDTKFTVGKLRRVAQKYARKVSQVRLK